MKAALTFVIPVRHHENATNWGNLKKNLSATVRSIAAQDCDKWNAVIVANSGADLPEVPPRFEIVRVDFPPNTLHRQGDATREDFLQAFRFDKGRRVLAGLLSLQELGHVMIVDDDDFVSRQLASYASANTSANGWYVREGFVWSDGGSLVYRHNDFSNLCGTSHIVNSELYRLPRSLEDANDDYIRTMLGSHIFLEQTLRDRGTPLMPLPFIGAVYRTGHAEAHSRSRGIISQFLIKRYLLRHPVELLKRVERFRFVNRKIKREFFGH